ncbi:MAG: arylsulfatase [Verrucomicrobiales bacterium]|nr:arylsulfatase [Verrucomicrobiales bacterium]
MNRAIFFSFLIFLFPASLRAERPNVIVVLTDDLGFSDLGCYGGEIETPTLDRLAAGGLRFSQFYNTAKCHSSRVSLLSGRWCKQAGDIDLNRAVTIPEVLEPNGYFTAMTGKWHLSKNPRDFGFKRYWGHLSGACNFFTGDQTFRLDRDPWTVPESDFYTTVANVDFALEFLGEARKAEEPYFLYVAFNAPHAPLQPLKEDYEKYEGRYDAGWDEVRAARLEKQKELGLFGTNVTAGPRPESIPAWKDLSPEMQNWESRRMTALAGMIDRVDQEMGRLVADLEANGELDNTLIVFLSDNGACPYDRRSTGISEPPYLPTTSWSDSTGWAWARNSPFRYYKQNQFEGGITTPAIFHWPAGLQTDAGSITHEPAHLVDLLPTIAEATGSAVPSEFPDRELSPLAGTSLVPVFEGKSLADRPPIHLLFATDRGFRDGKWKLVSFRSGPWELYDMESDRTERHNLAAKYPERVKTMATEWTRIAREQLRDPAPPVADEAKPHVHPEWTIFDSPEASSNRRSKKGQAGGGRKANQIRARRGTTIERSDGILRLSLSGDDPGLAIDRIAMAQGANPPFTLTFSLKSRAGGSGDVFFTTDPKTSLPKGTQIPFKPEHSDEWETFSIEIPADRKITALRLDPATDAGTVDLKDLKLIGKNGNVVVKWE